MVDIPEIEDGLRVDSRMCRNPMRPHFGLLEGEGASALWRLKRRKKEAEPRVFCRACGLSSSLFAEASVRPAVRHFLRQSLPFATCPTPHCPNHAANVFERFGTAYRCELEHKVHCLACGCRFHLGRPLGNAAVRREAWLVCWEVALTRTITDTPEGMDGRLAVD